MTTPVKGKERIVELDVIRGFALFGVLLVNMTLFKSTDFYVSKAPGDFISPIDQGFAWLIRILASGNFYGFGLGLYGSVRLWWGVLLTVLIFAAQIFSSKLWLAYYQFGQTEWIWRNLTCGKKFPLRKG